MPSPWFPCAAIPSAASPIQVWIIVVRGTTCTVGLAAGEAVGLGVGDALGLATGEAVGLTVNVGLADGLAVPGAQ